MKEVTKKDIEMKHRTNLKTPEEKLLAQVAPLSKRYLANQEILKAIGDLLIVFPEQRFGQIICNYVFPNYREQDPFYEESVDTLKRLSGDEQL